MGSALEKQTPLLECLHEAASLLAVGRTEEELARGLVLSAMGLTGVARGIVLLERDEGYEILAAGGSTLERGLVESDLELGRLPNEDIETSKLAPGPLRELLEGGGLTTLFPLRFDERTTGFLALARSLLGQDLSADARRLLLSLSVFYAVSMRDAHDRQRLRQANDTLERQNATLESLFEVGRRFSSTLEENEIFDLLAFSLMGNLALTRVTVLITQEEEWLVATQKGRALSAAFRAALPLPGPWCRDADSPGDLEDLLAGEKLGALLPVAAPSGLCALVAIGRPLSGQPLCPEDRRLVSTFASVALAAVENARLFQDMLEKQRLARELAIARTIQEGLCPQTLPQVHGLEVAAATRPSREVGGDLFEAVLLEDGSALFAVADVTGKGVAAALLAASIQAAIRTLCRAGLPLHEIAERVNLLVYEQTDAGRFATCFFAHFDPASRQLTTCSAGHDPALLLRAGQQPLELSTGGLLLGVVPGARYELERQSFAEGACLAVYTDGLTEAQAPPEDPQGEGEELGLERLSAMLREELAGRSLTQALPEVLKGVSAFTAGAPPADDRTLLLLRGTGSSA